MKQISTETGRSPLANPILLSRAASPFLPLRSESSALNYRSRMIDDPMGNVIGECDGMESEDSPSPPGDRTIYVVYVHPLLTFLSPFEIL